MSKRELDCKVGQVRQTALTSAAGKHYLVSTVRLACRHVGGIYETMVFEADAGGNVVCWTDLDMRRYETEPEASTGHDAMVSRWEGEKEPRERLGDMDATETIGSFFELMTAKVRS